MPDASQIEAGRSFVFRKLDSNSATDITNFCPIFWEYWWEVNGEDISGPVFDEKLKIEVPKTEAMLYAYLTKGYEVLLCQEGESVVGFMVYHVVFHHLLEIRGMYVEKAHEGQHLGKGLINALEEPIERVFFQSRIEKTPDRVLEVTLPHRREVGRTEKLITWEMKWRKDGRQ